MRTSLAIGRLCLENREHMGKRESYIDHEGNLVDPKAKHPWNRLKRTVRNLPAAILLVFFGLALSELICLAGLIEALVSQRSKVEWGVFGFLLVVIPVMMGLTLAVGSLLPKHGSDIIPGSGRAGERE